MMDISREGWSLNLSYFVRTQDIQVQFPLRLMIIN